MRQRHSYILKNPYYKIGFHYIGKTMEFDSLARLFHFQHTLAVEFLAYATERDRVNPSVSRAMKKHKDLRVFLVNMEQICESDFDALIDLTGKMFTCDALETIPIYNQLVSSLDDLENNLWRMYKKRKRKA